MPLLNETAIVNGPGNDRLIDLHVDDDVEAKAIGIENRGMIATQGGDDLIRGTGTARGSESALAFGILNEGRIELGAGFDVLEGIATATGPSGAPVDGSAVAYGYSEINLDEDGGTGSLSAGADADKVIGKATANGKDDVGALGLLFVDADMGAGNDTIAGSAVAEGTGSTDARGISVGISDVDDDVLEPPFTPATVGTLATGLGNDVLEGRAEIVVEAGPDDQVFFAGANAVLVDGGAEAQWIEIVKENAEVLAQAVADQAAGDRFAVTEALQPLLARIDTSTLDTGDGDDRIIADVRLIADSVGFEVDPDDDLEVIADAIENAGTLTMGAGNDKIVITMDVRSTIDGAKALGDPLDNSSVGLITGYGAIATNVLQELGLIDDDQVVEVEVNSSALFDLGDGDDRITTNTFVTAVDDLSAGDGLGNRGLWVGGNGSEFLDLKTVSVFVLGEVEVDENGVIVDNEQREGIADGWESRNIIFMDDILFGPDGEILEGPTDGDGNDVIKADATAFGNGVLTISDGFEAREFTNTGGGNDLFDLTARAFVTEVDRANPSHVGVLASNITVATGLQTEQVDEGDLLTRDGNDTLIGRATAAPAHGLDPFDFDPGAFDPNAFDPASDAFANRSTIAQGISQVSGDADNDGSRDLGVIDTGGAGQDNDVLIGEATALGVADVQSYGILLTEALTGAGADRLDGEADAIGRNVALANGIAVGISNNTDNDGRELRADQAGRLSTGDGNDILDGTATATTFTDGAPVVSDANADSNGILVDLGSSIDTGAGFDTILAKGFASDFGAGGAATIGVSADGIENRGTLDLGDGNNVIDGFAEAISAGGVPLTIAGGIDNGFGSTRNNIPVEPTIVAGAGNDRLEGEGVVVAVGGIGLASGIETSGTIATGDGNDILVGRASSLVTDGIRSVADGIENSRIVEGGTGGLIDTGAGNDTLIAVVTATGVDTDAQAIAIRNDFDERGIVVALGHIDLGAGDDVIEASARASSTGGVATAIGIRGGTISTGAGNDRVEAESDQLLMGENGVVLAGGRGLGGDVVIDMGSGNDLLAGFGDAIVFGGTGTDTIRFAFALEDFALGGGTITDNGGGLDFAFAGEVLATSGFEVFFFDGIAFSFDDLLLLA